MLRAWITGVAGERLDSAERRLLAEARPCGLILFARNCTAPEQIRALVDEFKSAVGSADVIISIDQEGGRVQRLAPPQWRALPSGECYGELYARDCDAGEAATYQAARLIAADLLELGINCNMVPVLDLPGADGHAIISDRAYGDRPQAVAALGRAMAQGHMDSGVLPVMKHIPGHGRATSDSHLQLPIVDASREELHRHDFEPFRSLNDLPAAMTAHVVYSSIDGDHPASTSPAVHQQVIRGAIGFDGLLMSDDLSMKALSGDYGARTEAVLAAGSDIALHCNGKLHEMTAVAATVPSLTGRSLSRFAAALAVMKDRKPVDIARAEAAIAGGLALMR